jgi:nucleoside-diphosphate-sugar epimerase
LADTPRGKGSEVLNVVATGASGAIGKHLEEVSDLALRLPANEIEAKLALKDYKCDTLLHLAAVTNPLEVASNPGRSRAINVESTVSLMRGLIRAGGNRFIFASTGHVYGPQRWGHLSSEMDPTNAISAYASQKLEAEYFLTELAKEYGISLIIARIFSIFGPGMPEHYLAGMAANAVQKGAPLPTVRNADDIRDFSSPIQVAAVLTKLARSNKRSVEILNIATGNPMSVMERILKEYPIWPQELFERRQSSLPWLVGSPVRLTNYLRETGKL